MLDRFRSHRLDHAPALGATGPPLDVERVVVQGGPSDHVTVEVSGTWRLVPLRDPPPAVLEVREGDHVHRLTGADASRAGTRRRSPAFAVAFTVPAVLEPFLSEGLTMSVGGAALALPAPEFEPAPPIAPAETVAERRALRAELSERELHQHLATAERELAHERERAGELERRTELAEEMREALETRLSSRLADRERELRAARQRAESERRLRDEEAGEAARRLERAAADADTERLRARTLAAHAARLMQELEALRRSESEALQAAVTADTGRHQARRELAAAVANLDAAQQRCAALEREVSRLHEREQAARAERAADEPDDRGEGPAPAAAGDAVSEAAEPEPPSRPPAPPWLERALPALAARDPDSATRLSVALLPFHAAIAPDGIDYDLLAAGAGWYRVTGGPEAQVSAMDRPRPRREADFRLRTDARALAALLTAGGRGRRGARPRVRGTLRRRRIRGLLPALPLRLDELAAAGAEVPVALAFRALAQLIEPAWTVGHGFCVAHEVRDADERTDVCYVRVRDGRDLVVAERPPELIDATVRSSRRSWTALMSGLPAPAGERPSVLGDTVAVARLHEWTRRAQGLDAPPG